MGERSIAVLNSTRVSSEKIEATGFVFEYNDIEKAVKSLI
jgi:NAD dependent epimerase/dehydratase family enzyme